MAFGLPRCRTVLALSTIAAECPTESRGLVGLSEYAPTTSPEGLDVVPWNTDVVGISGPVDTPLAAAGFVAAGACVEAIWSCREATGDGSGVGPGDGPAPDGTFAAGDPPAEGLPTGDVVVFVGVVVGCGVASGGVGGGALTGGVVGGGVVVVGGVGGGVVESGGVEGGVVESGGVRGGVVESGGVRGGVVESGGAGGESGGVGGDVVASGGAGKSAVVVVSDGLVVATASWSTEDAAKAFGARIANRARTRPAAARPRSIRRLSAQPDPRLQERIRTGPPKLTVRIADVCSKVPHADACDYPTASAKNDHCMNAGSLRDPIDARQSACVNRVRKDCS